MELNKFLKIIAGAILAVLMFLAGRFSFDGAGIEKKAMMLDYDAGYNAAWNKAETLIDSTQIPILPQIEKIYSIAGKIKSISFSDASLIIEANPVSFNPLSEDSKPTVRTIKTTSSTKIVKMTPKTSEEIKAEIEQKNLPLMPFSEEKIDFGQLGEGDVIIVTSDKNIKSETEITATKIAAQK
ncbi:MAG: hypothetical protein V1732_02295 [Patescibacteria group bacterium]